MNKKIAGGVSAAAAIASLLMASPSHAAIRWDLKPIGMGDFDWKLSGIYSYYDQTFGSSATSFQGILWANSAAECLEIATGPGHTFSNPDTRIWVRDSGGNWVSINDDSGGTLQSRARLWIAPLPGDDLQYFTEIRPYDSTGNYDDWQVSVTRRDLSETQCAPDPPTANTIAWAKLIGTGTNNYNLTRSSNAT